MEQARHGDVCAFDVLVTRYQTLATRAAYLILGDPAAAEDVAQEAFVKAYYALARFEQGRPFRPWLLRIVTNEAHNRYAAESRRAAVLQMAETQRAGDDGPSAETAAVRAEARRALLQALAALPADDRLVISYRYLLDLSEGEMAEALDCPRGTVKSRLSRALGRLRARLSADATLAEDAGGARYV